MTTLRRGLMASLLLAGLSAPAALAQTTDPSFRLNNRTGARSTRSMSPLRKQQLGQ
jgi:hypothetical protein